MELAYAPRTTATYAGRRKRVRSENDRPVPETAPAANADGTPGPQQVATLPPAKRMREQQEPLARRPLAQPRNGTLNAFFATKVPTTRPATLPPPPPAAPSEHVPPPQRPTQTHLNFGQRIRPGTLQICRECQMHYVPTDPDDRQCHERYHAAIMRGIRYPGYKQETLLAIGPKKELPSGLRLVLVDPGAVIDFGPGQQPPSAALCTKARSVIQHVDECLGAVPTPDWTDADGAPALWVVLAVVPDILPPRPQEPIAASPFVAAVRQRTTVPVPSSNQGVPGTIAGCLVIDAAAPESAWRVDAPDAQLADECRVADLSEVRLAVARMWTSPAFARRGVASAMLAAVCDRLEITVGQHATAVAFSQPTLAGWALASRFVGSDRVLVYN
ncbi:hypothetical protein BC828DRAFT_378252 [Blastocladiella britannica]|nr:hypothetical protein BC828DRAFT_378252 [Blastocladiella britannica]